MTLFYNITGVLIGIISMLMLRQYSFISKDKPELRSAAKFLHIIFLLASISMFTAQFEVKLPHYEFEKLNALMLLFFFLIGQGYVYTMLSLLNQSRDVKQKYLKKAFLPTFSLFALYTVLYFIVGDQKIYSGTEFLALLPHKAMLMFRCVLLAATIFNTLYGMYLCRKLRAEYIRQAAENLSAIELKQSVGMSQIQLSTESLAVWALLTYFYTSPVLEVVSCTLITIMLAFQYHGFRNYTRYQIAGTPYSVYVTEEIESMDATDEITKTGRYDKLLVSFIKLIEEDEIYLQSTLRADETASRMHTNRTYLSRMIKEEFQCTFSDYINGKRIEYAKKKMQENPNIKLTELAENSGFVNVSSFGRTFKRLEGLPPKEWIKKSLLE